MSEQVDGAFHRLNYAMLQNGTWAGNIVSLVGKAVGYDGNETLEFECVDGGKLQVQVDPAQFTYEAGKIMEIMGAANNEDKSIPVHFQHFISRELGEDFDFANYNELISKVLINPKYTDLFGV
ncbi:hypothetical protein ACHAXR_011156 [Thalassiosira sp. AJA248-18]